MAGVGLRYDIGGEGADGVDGEDVGLVLLEGHGGWWRDDGGVDGWDPS